MNIPVALALLSALFSPASLPAAEHGALLAPVDRTVYVTVTAGKGEAIEEMTAADFVVKEGGKEREILKAARASARMRLALAVEERLIADSSVRAGVFDFVKRVANAAEISLITIGISNRTIVPFTPDPNAVLDGINKLTLNPGRDSNVAEGILQLANEFVTAKPERPVLVVVALAGGQAGVDPRSVLEKLGESAATMYSVTLEVGGSVAPVEAMAEQAGREQILSDGPKQSGGRRLDAGVTGAVPRALEQVSHELLAQYAITYRLPDGVKPNKRVSVSTRKRGVSLRAPTVIPER